MRQINKQLEQFVYLPSFLSWTRNLSPNFQDCKILRTDQGPWTTEHLLGGPWSEVNSDYLGFESSLSFTFPYAVICTWRIWIFSIFDDFLRVLCNLRIPSRLLVLLKSERLWILLKSEIINNLFISLPY